jgi:hypothetical protein
MDALLKLSKGRLVFYMKKIKIYIRKSFKITGRGIIVEIQHHLSGLPKETRLMSSVSGLLWEVQCRVFYDHVNDKHVIFEKENFDYMRLTFSSEEKKQASIQQIIENERQRIFEYLIKPIGHDEKPGDEEELEVME